MMEKIWRYARWSNWEQIYESDRWGWTIVDLPMPHMRYGCGLVWLCKRDK